MLMEWNQDMEPHLSQLITEDLICVGGRAPAGKLETATTGDGEAIPESAASPGKGTGQV
jgi:hypothetical protein